MLAARAKHPELGIRVVALDRNWGLTAAMDASLYRVIPVADDGVYLTVAVGDRPFFNEEDDLASKLDAFSLFETVLQEGEEVRTIDTLSWNFLVSGNCR